MQQSGLLNKIRPTDYILGVNSPLKGEDINLAGDWIPNRPSEEKQYNLHFDTNCCATFHGTNPFETLFNFFLENGEFSDEQIKWAKKEGYIEDGKFNFSDRFSAISNGTMPNGQYIQVVWDDFRHTGLIPEKDLPFGKCKNQAEYLDKKLITPAMLTKAKKFLEVMIEKDANGKPCINYELVPVETGFELNEALKQAPLEVAVTKDSPTHAITLLRMDTEFESYAPFTRKRNRTIAYALKPIIKVKKTAPTTPKWKYFHPDEKTGSEGRISDLNPALVDKLDIARDNAGIPFVISSGKRSVERNAEVNGVENSSHLSGLAVDIRARNSNEHFLITRGLMAAGFPRISRKYETHIHADIDPSKPQNTLF